MNTLIYCDGTDKSAVELADKIRKENPAQNVGIRNGYFFKAEEAETADAVHVLGDFPAITAHYGDAVAQKKPAPKVAETVTETSAKKGK